MEIVRATTKQDCEICDKLMAKLMQFEANIDKSIFADTNIEGFHEKSLQQDGVFLAYAKLGKPIGYIYGYLKNAKGSGTTTNRVFVDSLYVDEDFRHKGVGKLLLNAFEDWATKKYGDDHEVELLCLTNNKKALSFYQNLGYSEVKLTLRKGSKETGREK